MIAVLIVLHDSSDENLNGGAAMLRRVKEAAVAALREAGLASAAASTLFGEGVLMRCAHWEPAWASARSKAGAPPPPDGYTGERSSLWSLLAWRRSYHGPSDPVSGRAHYAIAQALAELAEAAPTAPLVVVAQGLGCLVAEAHFACLVEQRALPPTWADALLTSDHATPLERGATLHSFWALGSPIAMWLDTLKVRGEPAGGSRGGGGVGDDAEDTSSQCSSQLPSTRAPRYHERLERARKANSSTPDGASLILARHLSEDAPSPAPAAGNAMEQHTKEAVPRSIREQGLVSVPSPQMSSSMPVAVLQLGGRHHFWHRHDPLCSIPITQEYGLGSAAKDVEVRLGGSSPPAPSDYLKAIDYEKRSGRTKKEVVVPLGRHLASILLGLRSQETQFDRIVERRPTSAAEQQAMADMLRYSEQQAMADILRYSSLVGKPSPSTPAREPAAEPLAVPVVPASLVHALAGTLVDPSLD